MTANLRGVIWGVLLVVVLLLVTVRGADTWLVGVVLTIGTGLIIVLGTGLSEIARAIKERRL